MTAPILVVCGPPGSGKTTLARRLGPDLGLVVLSKDDLKEPLFDALGIRDREWSRRLGGAAYAILYATAWRVLEAGVGAVIESNFRPEAVPALRALCAQRRALIVHCDAAAEILAARFADRGAARHPGHADAAIVAEILADRAAGAFEPPPIGVPVVRVRTDGTSVPAYEDVRAVARERLSRV